jgi:uncharacterized protein
METNFKKTNIDNMQSATIVSQKNLLASVFAWMFVGMVLTTIASLAFAYIPSLLDLLLTVGEDGYYHKSIFGHIITFAPLAILIGMGFGYRKLSFIAVSALFMFFSLILGISFSFIFIIYQIDSIATVFLSTSALFAIMATVGYFTKTDLTKLGSILMVGALGVVSASVINYFMGNKTMGYIISIIGVVVFTGLTAYDMQKIKNDLEFNDGSDSYKKRAVLGALSLYVDFINLFISLLNVFGSRK